MKSARINFGVPNSEYVLLADDNGEAVSLKNQDLNTEYIGGGGVFATVSTTPQIQIEYAELSTYDGNPIHSISLITINENKSFSLSTPNEGCGYLFYKDAEVFSLEGSYEEVTIAGELYWLITGDVTIS